MISATIKDNKPYCRRCEKEITNDGERVTLISDYSVTETYPPYFRFEVVCKCRTVNEYFVGVLDEKRYKRSEVITNEEV